MTSSFLFAATVIAVLGALAALYALAIGRHRAPPAVEPPPVEARATVPETPRARTAAAEPVATTEPAFGAAPTLPAEPPDPAQVAARDMARTAYDIAQHLGFDAMPDRARPSLRKLRIPLDGELSHRAAALLAAGAHACVQELTVTRDQRAAITVVDLSAAPPS